MPVSVVVGGQYGSEGKGKVALELVRRDPNTTIVVRPGGSNSGHTAYAQDGRRHVLRQLPAASIDNNVRVILPAGAYIDVELLEQEIAATGIDRSKIVIDPRAHVIRAEHREWERNAGLVKSIGSTGSGTGAAVLSRLARYAASIPPGTPAAENDAILPFVRDTTPILRDALENHERIVVEGTQGFGLSPLHGDAWPRATARDTTAAGFLSETGLSPLDVDKIVLVIRCHPIRVAGDSGPLPSETTWTQIATKSGAPTDLTEFTSVTGNLRRVGLFDPCVVLRAIAVNRPTCIALNHMDYIDWKMHQASQLTKLGRDFLHMVEDSLDRSIDWIGVGPAHFIDHATAGVGAPQTNAG